MDPPGAEAGPISNAEAVPGAGQRSGRVNYNMVEATLNVNRRIRDIMVADYRRREGGENAAGENAAGGGAPGGNRGRG